MSKQWKPKKDTVELRPSRIRREPVRADKPLGLGLGWKVQWDSREWEIRLAIAGIIFFTLGINAVVYVIGEVAGN